MKASALKYSVLMMTLGLVTIVIALLPFHAFLTIWISSVIGHYTAVRLWKEVLVLLAGLGVLYLVAFDRKVRFHTLKRKLTWLIVAYAVWQVAWSVFSFERHNVGTKALAYGLLINLRFLVFFMITWAVALRTDRLEKRWLKLLLWPVIVVVIFGILEVFILPRDFLKHFGYGPNTIAPYETINHNVHYLRYMSTLRGANPLGAYLLLPVSALVVLLVRYPRSWNWTKALLLIGSLVMLYFSFSRSAWLGAVLSVLTVLVIANRERLHDVPHAVWAAVGVLLVFAAAALAFELRHNTSLQNVILHTQTHSSVKSTSNGAHVSALRAGLHDVIHEPLGRGAGSAGPASFYNNHPARIAEDYYIQIGQEAGWIGMALFVAINLVVAYLLWLRRQSTLSLSLLAALVGISFVGLLSHVWTDDTLCYIWWGLAGIAIGTPLHKTTQPVEDAEAVTAPSAH